MKKVLKGFSEKKDGSMYSPPTKPVPENIANRKRFFESKELDGRQIALAGAVHGTHVAIVTPASPHVIPQTDALVTKGSDIVLALTGADCFPVYFEEKKAGLIGLAHSGWRGIVAGIIGETVETLEKLGGHKDDVVLTIGPGICARHFEIKEDVLASFAAYPEHIIRENGLRVDLAGIIRTQAEAYGVTAEHISASGECTYCLKDKYFSYRRDKPVVLENQLAYIVQFTHRKFR